MRSIYLALGLILITSPAFAQWHGGWHGGWGHPGWHGGFGIYGVPVPVPAPYTEEYIAPVRTCWWSHRWHRRVCMED